MSAAVDAYRQRAYGVMAEYEDPEALVQSAWLAHEAGYRRMDAYSPFPIEGLADAIGMHRSWIPWIVLIAGFVGGITGYLFQVAAMGIWYPLNIGGRPYNSLLAFVPVTFELTILFASLSAIVALLIVNRLPEPYHPVFNVERFKRATTDGFFLVIQADDPKFEYRQASAFLRGTGAREVYNVPD